MISTFSVFLAAVETLRHMLDFRSSVLFWIGIANLYMWLGDMIWITTFATNLISCSAVKLNVWVVWSCGRAFWLTTEAYVFWLLTTCCLNACFFFVFRTPFVRRNVWSVTIGTCRFSRFSTRASFVRVILSSDLTFLFWPTSFCWVSETLAVVALHNWNGSSKFLHHIHHAGYMVD